MVPCSHRIDTWPKVAFGDWSAMVTAIANQQCGSHTEMPTPSPWTSVGYGDVFVVGSAEAQRVEVEQAERVEGGHLPVDDAGPRRDSRERATQFTEALGAVVSALGKETHKAAVLVQLDAPAAELCFVQPARAAGRERNTGLAGTTNLSMRDG